MYFLERRCPVCRVFSCGVCASCLDRFSLFCGHRVVQGIDIYRSLYRYSGAVQKAILAIKQGLQVHVLHQLADIFSRFLHRVFLQNMQIDVVTWVPTNRKSYRKRGFDQSKVLAQAVSKQLEVPCRSFLFRDSDIPQVGKSRVDRLIGPRLFGYKKTPKTVLLLDDVVTTGASLQRAANILREQGTAQVIGASLSVVP